MADGSPLRRDVKNHLLFEISTEVANRGTLGRLTKVLATAHSLNLFA